MRDGPLLVVRRLSASPRAGRQPLFERRGGDASAVARKQDIARQLL